MAFFPCCEDLTDEGAVEGCEMSFGQTDWNNDEYQAAADLYSKSRLAGPSSQIKNGLSNSNITIGHNCSIYFATDELKTFQYSGNMSMNLWAMMPSNILDLSPGFVKYPTEVFWPLTEAPWNFRTELPGHYDDCESCNYCGMHMRRAERLTSSSFLRYGYAKLSGINESESNQRLSVRKAQACSTNPCVKQISATVTNGITNFHLSAPQYGAFIPNLTRFCYNSLGPEDTSCFSGNTWAALGYKIPTPLSDPLWTLNPFWDTGLPPSSTPELTWNGSLPAPAANFYISANALSDIRRYVLPVISRLRQAVANPFGTGWTQNGTVTNNTIPVTQDRYNNGFLLSVDSADDMDYINQQGGLPRIVDRLADSLTRYVHEQANTTVTGTAFEAEVYVRVRWAWLFPPGFVHALGVVFVFSTIFVCRKDGRPPPFGPHHPLAQPKFISTIVNAHFLNTHSGLNGQLIKITRVSKNSDFFFWFSAM
jgi:hypothetical protein